jgi:hypothetical protein
MTLYFFFVRVGEDWRVFGWRWVSSIEDMTVREKEIEKDVKS